MSNLKNWIVAARLRTLPLAISGIILGTSLSASKVTINWSVFYLTILTAILLQILSNLANDYGDAVSGVDSDIRKGPERMVQTGAISRKSMGMALVLFSLLTLLSGVFLIWIAFPNDFISLLIFLSLGLAGIVAAIKYTVGKNPYGYIGLGDIFVFLFFGWVAVLGTYYLQVSQFDWLIMLPASTIGFFSVGVLNLNNIRDITSDKLSGKLSIPVRVGKLIASRYHAALLIIGMACTILFISLSFRSWIQWVILISFIPVVRNISVTLKKEGMELDPYLKQLALSTLFFSVLFLITEALSWFV